MTKARMDDNRDWPAWLRMAWDVGLNRIGGFYVDNNSSVRPRPRHELFQVNTPEGNMRVMPDDWLIKGVAGELYPCKPEVFEKSYEAVDG